MVVAVANARTAGPRTRHRRYGAYHSRRFASHWTTVKLPIAWRSDGDLMFDAIARTDSKSNPLSGSGIPDRARATVRFTRPKLFNSNSANTAPKCESDNARATSTGCSCNWLRDRERLPLGDFARVFEPDFLDGRAEPHPLPLPGGHRLFRRV